MLFNSYVFLCCFLPSVLVVLFLLRRYAPGGVKAFLLLASLFFYSYWNLAFLPVLLVSAAFNFSLLQRISAPKRSASGRLTLLRVGLIVNLLGLFAYKYAGFAVTELDRAFGLSVTPPSLALPLGISFFTFTQIAFLVDTYRDRYPKVSAVDYGLFVTYFPHLIAGPILHHEEIFPQYPKLGEKPQSGLGNLMPGIAIFVVGLAKKVLLADDFAKNANLAFASVAAHQRMDCPSAWMGLLSYTLQIYYDFSGYSDMAVGLGMMIGLKVPANFNSPYQALSIVEFWRRWHITLSRFLRDYLYIPLGGNRHGKARRYLNLFVTMLLGGLWHGANWTYVIWGGLHGLYLAVNHLYAGSRVKPRLSGVPGYAAVCWGVTFASVMLAWVFFRASSVSGALAYVSMLVPKASLPAALTVVPVLRRTLAKLALGMAILAVPNIYVTYSRFSVATNSGDFGKRRFVAPAVWGLFLALLLFFSFILLGRQSEFLYFQF